MRFTPFNQLTAFSLDGDRATAAYLPAGTFPACGSMPVASSFDAEPCRPGRRDHSPLRDHADADATHGRRARRGVPTGAAALHRPSVQRARRRVGWTAAEQHEGGAHVAAAARVGRAQVEAA